MTGEICEICNEKINLEDPPIICDYLIQIYEPQASDAVMRQAYTDCFANINPTTWEDVAHTSFIILPLSICFFAIIYFLNR